MPRVDDLLRHARMRLAPGEAELLLAHALERPRSWLYAHGDHQPEPARVAAFEALLARRGEGVPVAYLLGTCGFWGLELEVSPATLIPRPETERVVELALARIPRERALEVVDLGTGSGAIALAIAHERPLARVTATDASADALTIARANARRLRIGNVAFRHGDWWDAVGDARYDVAVGNPPYIRAGDPHLAQGDLRFEPAAALASGPDGLDAIRAIAAGAGAHLRAGGWLLVEHGWDQGEAVRAVFGNAGLVDVHTAQDLEHRDRVTLGRLP